jgi:signal transduction histidine kinase/CheY-like chemotaxis protein
MLVDTQDLSGGISLSDLIRHRREGSDDERSARLFNTKIHLLIQNTRVANSANFLVAGLFAVAFWDTPLIERFATWAGVVVVHCIAMQLYFRWVLRDFGSRGNHRAAQILTISSAILGVSWGGLSILFLDQFDTQIFQLIVIVIAGMVAGAAVSSAAYAPSAIAYISAAMIPIASVHFLGDSRIEIIIGVLSLVYCGYMIRFVLINNQTITNAIRHRIEIEDMADSLCEKTLSLEKSITAAERAQRDAEHANSAKSSFLAMMSHEIRTPLNGILGMTSVLKETKVDEQQRDYLEVIGQSGESLLTVINDILDFTRLDAGKAELDEDLFSPKDLIDQAIRLFSIEARSKKVELGSVILPAVPEILFGDEMRFRQIVLNLLGNAIKFTDEGSVTIKLDAIVYEEDVVLDCRVTDTGIGIDLAAQSSLFEQFSQADSSITRKFGGTGLGLAISKQLAELMGGEIGLESRPGLGSTFWFTASCQTASAEQQLETTDLVVKTEARDLPQATILIAEDNRVNRVILTSLFKDTPVRFKFVENGEMAIKAVQNDLYDLILMDIQMPVLDGIAATRAIRALPGVQSQTPIVAMTAHAMAGDEDHFIEAGMDDYISKPIDFDLLFRLVRKYSKANSAASSAAEDSTEEWQAKGA